MKIKFGIRICGILLTMLSLASCKPNKGQKEPTVSFREEWFPSACFSGDMVALNETEKLYGIKIKVEPGAEDVDPVKLVLAGADNFGVAGGDRILTANKQGADLVILGVINYKSPTCFIALKDKNINKPSDFEGKIVGVMTGNNTEYVYKSLLRKANVDEKKIKEIEAPFDLVSFVNRVYDVRPAFVYDEPVSLDLKNIAYTTIKPEEYGVNFIGPVIFAKKEFIKNNKELTQNFINSMCSGWQNALKDPKTAISYLKKYDKNIDASRELKSLSKGKDYFSGEDNRPLFLSNNRWNLFVQELVQLKLISNTDNTGCFDNSFVLNYYNNKFH